MDLSVSIAGIKFKNPVTVASGTFGHAEDFYDDKELRRLGALIPKTVTLFPRQGNPPPRIVETPAGMINAIGIENPGVDIFITDKLPLLKAIGIPVIVSVSGANYEEFRILVEKVNAAGVTAVELNLSCPNLGKHSLVAQDPAAVERVVRLAKKHSRIPVCAKLSPNVTDIAQIAAAAEQGGADALSLVNTFQAMVIDVEKRRSKLGNFTGGLSGPAIRPIAVFMVHQVYRRIKIPIIAMGGIMAPDDALQYIIAGATMAAVGTANFIDPGTPLAVLRGVEDYLKRHGMQRISELRGSLQS
ncbi:MAG: dihydroorotate dehydrogenase [Candidatus Omnitrophica bacterium]|nr:dihydroorotate dehydrogenase [Candidatus Omnitrophota bacterium]